MREISRLLRVRPPRDNAALHGVRICVAHLTNLRDCRDADYGGISVQPKEGGPTCESIAVASRKIRRRAWRGIFSL